MVELNQGGSIEPRGKRKKANKAHFHLWGDDKGISMTGKNNPWLWDGSSKHISTSPWFSPACRCSSTLKTPLLSNTDRTRLIIIIIKHNSAAQSPDNSAPQCTARQKKGTSTQLNLFLSHFFLTFFGVSLFLFTFLPRLSTIASFNPR